jgi:aminoglycoside phosphotransferase (APT) family kinase protein
VRRLPDQLAGIAARLHALDPEPLADQLDRLPADLPRTTVEFIGQQTAHATELDRADLADAGQRLIDTEPASNRQVISHGDLHPFNLLITATGPVLIDWTVGRIAHPAFTVAFTELMLANPPIPLPRAGAAALKPVARNIARRFLKSYRDQATPAGQIDEANLDWHRKVHALRILVVLADWDAAGTRPARGHPWLILEPVASDVLDMRR